MKIRYQINAYDYIAFQMYHAMHKPFYKRMMLLTRIIPSVFLLLIPIFLSLFYTNRILVIHALLYAACLALVFWLSTRGQVDAQTKIKKNHSTGKNV